MRAGAGSAKVSRSPSAAFLILSAALPVRLMKKGFYTIIAAQFVSSLGDNALLIAAIAMLSVMHSASWVTPLLQIFFTVSYVLLAPFVGAFADSIQKRHVMFVSNALKAGGCALMILGVHPMIAYGVGGLGAAAYSPAKYGILTELLPAEKLIPANAWLESATVGSTILGTVIGGALVSQYVQHFVSGAHLVLIRSAADAAMFAVMVVYAAAAVINIGIPDTGARYPNRLKEPSKLIGDFTHAFKVLWGDKLAQIALWVTTLLWGAAVTLQLLVLKWADANLGLSLSKAAVLQGVTDRRGCGRCVGAVAQLAQGPAGGPVDGRSGYLHGVLQQGPVSGRLRCADRPAVRAALHPGRVSADDFAGCAVGLFHRADERDPAASRRDAAVRRSLDRGAEFQPEPRRFVDARRLRAFADDQTAGGVDYCGVRRVYLPVDGTRHAAPRPQ